MVIAGEVIGVIQRCQQLSLALKSREPFSIAR
jgi:hypothetical protein